MLTDVQTPFLGTPFVLWLLWLSLLLSVLLILWLLLLLLSYFYYYHYDSHEVLVASGPALDLEQPADQAIVAIFYPSSQKCEIDISLLSLQTQPNAAKNIFQKGVEYGKYAISSSSSSSSSIIITIIIIIIIMTTMLIIVIIIIISSSSSSASMQANYSLLGYTPRICPSFKGAHEPWDRPLLAERETQKRGELQPLGRLLRGLDAARAPRLLGDEEYTVVYIKKNNTNKLK